MTNKKIKELYADMVNSKSQIFDFSEGYTETWGIAINQTDDEQQNEQYAPMMNFIYPLPNDFVRDMQNLLGDDWQTKIKKKLCDMTLIYMLNDEKYFLALTGGGMDMSWEICETYLNLGYLPPLEFCSLPNMGADYNKNKTKRIIQACKRSCTIASRRAQSTKKDLKRLHNYSTNYAKDVQP